MHLAGGGEPREADPHRARRDVYFATDASGGVSVEAHEVAIQRMVQAGAAPITWMVLAAELQRDWASGETVAGYGEILAVHAGSTGTGLAWELQLMAGASAAPAGAAV